MAGYSDRNSANPELIQNNINQNKAQVSYWLNPEQIYNPNRCATWFGPRSGHNGYGVKTVATNPETPAPAQDLTDIESLLTNRKQNSNQKLNNLNLNCFKYDNINSCSNFLDPVSTHLTNPPRNYREITINRFYDLPIPAQNHVFYNWEINTQLEAVDNYQVKLPKIQDFDPVLPVPI